MWPRPLDDAKPGQGTRSERMRSGAKNVCKISAQDDECSESTPKPGGLRRHTCLHCGSRGVLGWGKPRPGPAILSRAARLANDDMVAIGMQAVVDCAPRVQQALLDLKLMRDVAQHIDEYGRDGGDHRCFNPISWLGGTIAFDRAREASYALLSTIRAARDNAPDESAKTG